MTTLVRRSWVPTFSRTLFNGSDFDRVFDRLLDDTGGAERDDHWLPSVESYLKDKAIHVRCDLPGVDPQDVDVSVEGTTLTVRGERKAAHDDQSGYREVRYGRFERILTIPRGVDPAAVEARYEHGVLAITIPLPAEVTGRKIPISLDAPTPKAA